MPRRIGYSIRPLRSGRYQVLVRADDGKQVGIGSWARKEDAEIAGQEAARDVRRRQWIDPRASDIPLAAWMTDWLRRKRESGDHGEKYASEARRMVDQRIAPHLGQIVLTDLTPGAVARWYDQLRADQIARLGHVGLVPAKTYRLLHAALADAKQDQLLVENPCTLKRAGAEASPERPLVTSQQVAELAAAIDPRYSALVLTAGWAGLRRSELARLERRDVDVLHGTLRVRISKSTAGVRTVHMPPQLTAVIDRHLATYVEADAGALVFAGPFGGRLTGTVIRRVFTPARDAVGLSHVHLHDLRHHAGTMTAVSGATQREIMARLGHSSTRAAARYQHVAGSRAQEVAAALGAAWVEPANADGKVRRLRG